MSAPTAPRTDPWWLHGVVYQVYVRSFADSDGDGVGDLPGITSRLPYLRDLGVDALWVTPFYASPQADHGYDVSDYYAVDPLFGQLADADDLLARAHELGLRVIVDLVPNHTSSQHPWFQAALAAGPGSSERERYLFRAGRVGPDGVEQPPNNWMSRFEGPAWTRVPADPDLPGEWYLHLFDTSQPDLNWHHPDVPAEFERILRFWLDRGVDGIRIDVAHGLFKAAGLPDQRLAPGESADPGESLITQRPSHTPMWNQPEVHEVYRRWHRLLASYDGDRMAIAEAWVRDPQDLADFVRRDELQQAFNFHWLAAPWSAEAFRGVIEQTLAVVPAPTWVLGNHDVVRPVTRYGGGPLGLARWRAALLTMLALPGSAYIHQGEELGLPQVDVPRHLMQDPRANVPGRGGRDGCRVPMPWSGTKPPFGFGPGEGQPWLPQPEEWADLAVEAQTGDETSTLEWVRRVLATRRGLQDRLRDADLQIEGTPSELVLRRGPLTCHLNTGGSPVAPDRIDELLAGGEVLLCSGDEPGGADTATWILRL
ncbi:glycoside hydrolase family 13 protein [Nocardioides jiangxiensis]|uniref:Glycoside hydrolase family 13 protein n=1 Tax=Nocardioides jiangxiensis TaxID=3064524 RepID=A0ABT9AZZ3_9ACTN|nr:glycoside hydrolase family 13 protein [Nocardioides sp. WY-20]MDO7867705.1 glycoside hydrolase family 13 protein [Nocardioides sp. WY-20]